VPIISVSVTRNAAIYSGTRLVIALQLAPMQIGIRNTLSMISISAMPSMPSFQSNTPSEPPFSTNCHCAPPISYCAHKPMPSTKSINVAASAIHRAVFAFTNRHAIAASAGIASMMLRIGKPLTMPPLIGKSPR
jgi:hypothetical protein